VGDYDKPSIRKIATRNGLLTAEKPESQEICFIQSGDYPSFIRRHAQDVDPSFERVLQTYDEPGPIRFKDGTLLGTHKGIYHFTVGQRRGLRIAHSRPLYVIRLDVHQNTVVVGYKEDAYSRGLKADGVNWLSRQGPEEPFEAHVRIRANHTEAPAQIRPKPGESKFTAIFKTPQLAVTPGQAAVVYQGERALGGGWISSPIPQ